jgi:hypothetical protein
MRAGGGVTLKEIENEFRAVSSLCMNDVQENIVEVLRHGELPNSPFFFLDMEVCAMNLDHYIQSEVKKFAGFEKVLEIYSILTKC